MNGGAPRPAWRDIDGVLLLDKPVGVSSNAALQDARRLFRARKAGHTGSLDPLASGLLPLCFGQATKTAAFLLDADKEYLARLVLGSRTASGDREGEVIERRPVPTLTAGRIEQALASLRGEGWQVPPMHSALKHQGERLYALARRGDTVARAARPIHVHALSVAATGADATGPWLDLRVRCSKGTYVRSLGETLAAALGTVGHLAALRRTALGPFTQAALRSPGELASLARDDGALLAVLLPVDAALPDWPCVALDSEAMAALRHGRSLAEARFAAGTHVRLYSEGRCVALAQVDVQAHLLVPLRLLMPGA
jgi:tRNA pseudouridine55 synthase